MKPPDDARESELTLDWRPHPDEPAALRRDIADELADHLACSVRKELLLGSDERAAWRRAHEKLGDARRLARRLWWLAMRERIMTQRWTLIGQWTLAACALVMVGLMWQSQLNQQRQLTLLTERLTAGTAPAPQSSLQVHVGYQPPGRTDIHPFPAQVGVRGVHLSNKSIAGNMATDAVTGVADFGTLPAGAYETQVTLSSKFCVGDPWRTTRRVSVEPSQARVEEFRFPTLGRFLPMNVSLAIDEPTRMWMRDSRLVTAAVFAPRPLKSGSDEWTKPDGLAYLLTPDGIQLDASVPLRSDAVEGVKIAYAKTYLWGLSGDHKRRFEKPPRLTATQIGVEYRLDRLVLTTDPRAYDRQSGRWQDAHFVEVTRRADAPVEEDRFFETTYPVTAAGRWDVPLPESMVRQAKAQLAERSAKSN